MIRRAIVAALVLSPLMIHAEDKTTAKPAGVRISTGVIAPKLIHTVAIQEDAVSTTTLAGGERKAVVSMIVDETGKPENVKLLQSAGLASTDQDVLTAVSQFRFAPGKLSGQTVAVPVNLSVTIQK
jgi:TonB family protein